MAADSGRDAVVFDLGGVLLDWQPEHLYRRLIPDEGQRRYFLTEVCPLEWNAEQDRGRPWAEAVAERSARFPAYAELIAAYDTRWDEMISGPVAGMAELASDLRQAGIGYYVLSNISQAKWESVCAAWTFVRDCAGAVISGAEGMLKPEPGIYRTLLARFGLSARRTFFTDDLAENVAGARACGIDAEQFRDAARLRAQLAARGVLLG